MKYLVTPECTVTRVKAPGILVEVNDADVNNVKAAEEAARELSGLGRFLSWNFNWNVKKLREKQSLIKLRNRKQND